MSLDVYLTSDKPIKKTGTGVYIREGGKTKELSLDEVKKHFPTAFPRIQEQEYETTTLYENNVTHNLAKMADEAGVYTACWRPEENGWTHAKQLIPTLKHGLKKLKENPEQFTALNPDNGWGTYEGLVTFISDYLDACQKYPDAKIEVSR